MIETIRKQIDSCPLIENKLYLLKSLDEKCGFFALNGQLLFMVQNEKECKIDTVQTEKLVLSTCVDVLNIANDATFKPGKYDFVLFNGDKDETDFESFIKISALYSKEKEKITIKEFFYSILDMFQLPKEQQFKNLIGLVGEITVLYDIYLKTGVCVACGWHENSTDRYDIAWGDFVIEVKTTVSDLCNVKVKHDQLFGRKDVILAAVRIVESNAGLTLENLITKINNIDVFANDFLFQLKLGKELKRISFKEYKQKKLEVKNIGYYINLDLPTIDYIPENITNLEYEYSLIDMQTSNIQDLIELKLNTNRI